MAQADEGASANKEAPKGTTTAKAGEVTVARPREPWWHSKGMVTVVTATIAIVPASVTGVSSFFSERGKLNLASAEFESEKYRWKFEKDHAAQAAFLDKAVDPARPTAMRVTILKYLAGSDRVDADVQSWARAEIPGLQQVAAEEAITTADTLIGKAAQQNAALANAKKPSGTEKPEEIVLRQQALSKQDDDIVRLERDLVQVRAASGAAGKEQKCDQQKATMRSDLRSGIDEQAGTARCKQTAESHSAGDVWIARMEGRSFECWCQR